MERIVGKRLKQWIGWSRAILSHPKLKDGHAFKPRVYVGAMNVQKKTRRKLLGLAPSTQGKSPLPKAERRRIHEREQRKAARP